MKLNNTVLTLALVGVLALAALAGGLLPMGNAVHADHAPPVFVSGNSSPSVLENTPPGVNIGNPVSATDDDEDGAEQQRHRVRRHPDLQPQRHGRGQVVRHRRFHRATHHEGAAGL